MKTYASWLHAKPMRLSCAITVGVTVALAFASCSGDNYDFKNAGDAMACYRKCLADLRTAKKTDAEGMTKSIVRYQTVNDTVFAFLNRDSALTSDKRLFMDFYRTNDSIKAELVRLAETWHCSFSDIYNIKRKTSAYRDDKDLQRALHNAEPFFSRLDSAEVPELKVEAVMYEYRTLLSETLRYGIKDDKALLRFFQKEDVLFRAFLTHFYDLNGQGAVDVTKNTERVCAMIYDNVKRRKINGDSVAVYINMRTTRRILQNAQVCLQDINTRKMQNKAQANAYLWVIIQPFTSIEPFAMALLTEADKKAFGDIAKGIPQSRNFAKAFDIDPATLEYLLPQQLLKMYITTL